jgi:hypothetical protein
VSRKQNVAGNGTKLTFTKVFTLLKTWAPHLPTHLCLLSLRLQQFDIEVLGPGSGGADSIHGTNVSILHQMFICLLQFDGTTPHTAPNGPGTTNWMLDAAKMLNCHVILKLQSLTKTKQCAICVSMMMQNQTI